ncbi:MAG: hypothetical protein M3Y70_01075 [Pseudomonadota bacterium]|nr:hypothetical protein [Pseudomonadota bacterium]
MATAATDTDGMEYRIRVPRPLPAFDAIEDAIRTADPAAVVDIDGEGTTLRIATFLPRIEVAGLVTAAGHPVPHDRVQQLPSICCGGCSG